MKGQGQRPRALNEARLPQVPTCRQEPKTPSPAELLALRGLLLGDEAGRQFDRVQGTGCRHTLHHSSQVSQLTFRGFDNPHRNSASTLGPATSSAALFPGCSRAHPWRGKTSKADRNPFHLPGESASSFELTFLPKSRGLPTSIRQYACGAGHSRVRYVLCGPFRLTSGSSHSLATFPFPRSAVSSKT